MLVLSRKENEKILIGDDIEIMIVRVGAKAVRIGIQAPEDIVINREEVHEALQAAQEEKVGE